MEMSLRKWSAQQHFYNKSECLCLKRLLMFALQSLPLDPPQKCSFTAAHRSAFSSQLPGMDQRERLSKERRRISLIFLFHRFLGWRAKVTMVTWHYTRQSWGSWNWGESSITFGIGIGHARHLLFRPSHEFTCRNHDSVQQGVLLS